jgi:hypothetical protein
MNPSLNEYRGAVRPFRFISCMETARGVGRSRNGRAWTPVVDGRDDVREDVLSTHSYYLCHAYTCKMIWQMIHLARRTW